MVWRVISDFDADPFNLDQKDVRGLVSIRISNNCLYHGKAVGTILGLPRKIFFNHTFFFKRIQFCSLVYL